MLLTKNLTITVILFQITEILPLVVQCHASLLCFKFYHFISQGHRLTDGAHQADGAHRFLHFEILLMQQRKVTLFFYFREAYFILERRIKIFQFVIKESDIFSFLTQLVVERMCLIEVTLVKYM